MKSEQMSDELRKLADIAADLGLLVDLRIKATELLGNMGTHEALLVLLELAGNDKLPVKERDMALKKSREIIKSGR